MIISFHSSHFYCKKNYLHKINLIHNLSQFALRRKNENKKMVGHWIGLGNVDHLHQRAQTPVERKPRRRLNKRQL